MSRVFKKNHQPSLRLSISFLFALSVSASPDAAWSAAAANNGKCYDDLVKECNASVQAAGVSTNAGLQGAASQATGGQVQSGNLAAGSALSSGSKRLFDAAELCRSKAEYDCPSRCGSSETDKQACQGQLSAIAEKAETQAESFGSNAGDYQKSTRASSSGGGGGGGGLGGLGALAGLAGGAAGLLAGMMANNKGGSQQQPQMPQQDPNAGALQANGTVDCSKYDAYNYSACNDQLSASCGQEIRSNQYGYDMRCAGFSNRYCGSPTTGGVVSPIVTYVNGSPTNGFSAIGQSGEGLGSQYCQMVTALSFCQTPGRSQCPSCQQLAAQQSLGCQQNPAACMSQSSLNQLSIAAADSCPTVDPIFSNPAVAASVSVPNPSSFQPSALPLSGLPDQGVPVVRASSVRSQDNVKGTVAAAGRLLVGDAPSGGVGSDVNGAIDILDPGSNSREVASTEAESPQPKTELKTPSLANYKPASDVQSQRGPSLFAMNSEIIRSRCHSGQFHNCP